MGHTITRDPRGSQAQLGYAVETTYGTPVVASTFIPAVPPIGLKPRIGMLQSGSRKPGAISRRISSDVHFNEGGEGQINAELTRLDMLKLMRWATGSTPTSAAQGGSAAYLHTFNKTLAAAAMNVAGTSLTIQTGVPFRSGAVEPFTFAGCKCVGWQLSCEPNETARLAFDVDSCAAVHTTDLATPTYPATHTPYSWFDAAVVKRAGSMLAGVNRVSATIENGLTGSDRKQFDGSGHYAEPILSSDPTCQLELEIEPSDLALTYDDWVSNTGRAWIVEFVGPIIASTYRWTYRLTIPDGYIQGEPPEVSGEELLTHTLTIAANDNGTDPLYRVEIISTETTV